MQLSKKYKQFLPGDLLSFSGYNLAGLVINLGSYGIPFFGLSHIGIAAEYLGKVRLFESTSLNNTPCLIQGKNVSGSQIQNIDTRIKAYPGMVKRIPIKKKLTNSESRRLTEYLIKNIGHPYDYLGAERSGGKLWAQLHRFFHEESGESLFCSEWVALALRQIDVFRTGNASSWNPNSLYRELVRRGIYCRRVKLTN